MFFFGVNLMLWIVELIGMLCIGIVLFVLIGVFGLDWIMLFVCRFFGVMM